MIALDKTGSGVKSCAQVERSFAYAFEDLSSHGVHRTDSIAQNMLPSKAWIIFLSAMVFQLGKQHCSIKSYRKTVARRNHDI